MGTGGLFRTLKEVCNLFGKREAARWAREEPGSQAVACVRDGKTAGKNLPEWGGQRRCGCGGGGDTGSLGT